jgi:hypothetical protein
VKCEVAVKGRNGTPFRNGTKRLFSLPTRERERRWELGRRCSLYMSFGQARCCGFCVHIHPSVLVVTFAQLLITLCSHFVALSFRIVACISLRDAPSSGDKGHLLPPHPTQQLAPHRLTQSSPLLSLLSPTLAAFAKRVKIYIA